MGTEKKEPKKPRGRPVTRKMPEQIPDTPENVARALMTTPPPKKWAYMEQEEDAKG